MSAKTILDDDEVAVSVNIRTGEWSMYIPESLSGTVPDYVSALIGVYLRVRSDKKFAEQSLVWLDAQRRHFDKEKARPS